MTFDQPHRAQTSRREILKGLGLAAAGASFSSRLAHHAVAAEPVTPSAAKSAGDAAKRHLLAGIDRKNLIDEYRRRELSDVSDNNLCQQAAAIISGPATKGGNSFTLHAPLELLARHGLMPLVDPKERELARLQMVGSAALFEESAPSPEPKKIAEFPDAATAKTEFARAYKQGDANSLESIMLQFAAQFGTTNLVHVLTPLALPTLSGASHSHIGLWLLLRHARTSDVGDASLLRAAARALAGDKGQLKSFSNMTLDGDQPLKQSPAEVERELLEKLANPTKGKGGGGMRALITAGEATGNADSLFGDFMRRDLSNEQIDAAFRTLLRVCAHSMLQHDTQHAKFGWSHCLTLPQAACGLSSLNMNRKLALAATLVWTTAYRSVLSNKALDFSWTPEKLEGEASLTEALETSPTAAAARIWHADPSERPAIKQTLATHASIRNDQHLIKYTRACLDMISFDPGHEQLYLAAAAHLCSVWVKEKPTAQIKSSLPI
jgi:hypothetical protein